MFVFIAWNPQFHHLVMNQRPDKAPLTLAVAPDCTKVNKESSEVIQATTVSKDETRMKGLSERREKLSMKEGMLFLFESEAVQNFWMKRTFIPLQILFFDLSGRLVGHHEMPVEKDPDHPKKTYPSQSPAIAALEVAPHRFPLKGVKGKERRLCVQQF